MKNIPLYEVRKINNLKDMLDSSVHIYGEKAAFLRKFHEAEAYSPVTYKEYKQDVDALGTALIHMGLKGKRIAVIGENRYEWAVSYLATVNGTGIVVPLDKELPANEIRNLLIRSKVSAIIYSNNISEKVSTAVQALDFIDFFINMDSSASSENNLSFSSLLEKGRQLLSQGDNSFTTAVIDNEEMSILLFTSGTTELAKAVMLSHRNIAENLMSMCSMLYISEKDTFLSVLPIHHTYECTCGFLCPIYRGATVAYCEGLRHIVKNLKESKTTVLLGVPLIFESMYRRIWDQAGKNPELLKKLKLGLKISNLLRKLGVDITKKLFSAVHENLGGYIRIFISGAAGIDPLVAKGYRELGMHIVQGYGLTECAPIVALNRDVDFKDDAAGLPLPGLEVKIHEPDSEGVGEIIVKGPSIMLGYYENPEATAKVLKNGWFHTGDLGYMDQDQFVHITGRKKNVIVTKNGKNIYPEEIETLLSRSPYILESMVVGKLDETSGETEVSAVIVANTDKIHEDFKDKELSSQEIRNLIQNEIRSVNKSLVAYKAIKDFSLRETEFAKTTTKKIKRYVEE